MNDLIDAYQPTTYPPTAKGLADALETLRIARTYAMDDETYDVFDNGRGYVIRWFIGGYFEHFI